jgi:hypothetical protein
MSRVGQIGNLRPIGNRPLRCVAPFTWPVTGLLANRLRRHSEKIRYQKNEAPGFPGASQDSLYAVFVTAGLFQTIASPVPRSRWRLRYRYRLKRSAGSNTGSTRGRTRSHYPPRCRWCRTSGSACPSPRCGGVSNQLTEFQKFLPQLKTPGIIQPEDLNRGAPGRG